MAAKTNPQWADSENADPVRDIREHIEASRTGWGSEEASAQGKRVDARVAEIDARYEALIKSQEKNDTSS